MAWDASIIGSGRMCGKLIEVISKGMPFKGRIGGIGAYVKAVYDSDPNKIGKTLDELYGFGGDLKVRDINDNLLPCHGILDFSKGEAVPENLPRVVEEMHPDAVVIGTTGIPSSFDTKLEELAKRTRIARSSNWAEKVYYFWKDLENSATRFLISNGYEVDVYDVHHHGKRDPYSGTALDIAKIIAGINSLSHDDIVIPIPFGDSTLYVPFKELQEKRLGPELEKYKSLRPPNKIVLHPGTRAGNIIGYHNVEFRKDGHVEKVECNITDRIEFASGAWRALLTILTYQDQFPLGVVYGPKDIFEF